MNEVTEVASYGSMFGAKVAAAHLESLGISATIVTDNAGGAFPSMTGLASGARLIVPAEDAERAKEALVELDDPLDEDED